jgi:hypothetical protein
MVAMGYYTWQCVCYDQKSGFADVSEHLQVCTNHYLRPAISSYKISFIHMHNYDEHLSAVNLGTLPVFPFRNTIRFLTILSTTSTVDLKSAILRLVQDLGKV